MARELSLPIDVVSIGPGQDVEDPWFDWAELRGIEEDGCLLVRPDLHIALRVQNADGDIREALARALERALARRLPVAGSGSGAPSLARAILEA